MKPQTLIEQAIFSVIRIESFNKKTNECSVGTGFVFGYRIDGERRIPFLVTNRHVIEGTDTGFINLTIKLNDEEPDLGKYEKIRINDFDKIWVLPDDRNLDIAFTPIAEIIKSSKVPNGYFYSTISQNIVPSDEQLNFMDAYEEVVFIGYPDGRWDRKNNLPIIRSGTTASPVYIDFEGQPIFLLDCSAFPGSSGSPVFKYKNGMVSDKRGNIRTENSLQFLGILTSSYFTEQYKQVELISSPGIPVVGIPEKIDIGEVIKARMLIKEIEKYLNKMK